jgi:phage baseplate assembly protein W
MIPSGQTVLNRDIEFAETPTHTFFFDIYGNVCQGYTDGLEAMEQAIYLILRTERYRHVIFSRNYGAELDDLFEMPVSWVVPEVERRIKEALLQDTRITAVDGFDFETGKGKLLVTFTAHTVFGDVSADKEVRFGV